MLLIVAGMLLVHDDGNGGHTTGGLPLNISKNCDAAMMLLLVMLLVVASMLL